jgi:hypothetical protein
VDFIEDLLVMRDSLDLPGDNPDKHYGIRRAFLKACFTEQVGHITEVYGGGE